MALTEAWQVGRNAYIIDALAYRCVLDDATSQLKLQVVPVGSQTWQDWLVIDAGGNAAFQTPPRLPVYTVATLPAGVLGMRAVCSDLLAPSFLAAAAGGGAVAGPVLFDGTQWVVA